MTKAKHIELLTQANKEHFERGYNEGKQQGIKETNAAFIKHNRNASIEMANKFLSNLGQTVAQFNDLLKIV